MQRDSKRFPPNSDTDIVFVSSDGIRYGIHSKNLETNTGGFPPVQSGGLSVSEPVHLAEPSSVLDLLFPFIYPERQPEIEDMSFKAVIELAEAAEKYQVYSAMLACRMCLRYAGDFVKDHPVEIALFAAKHDYPELLKLTAPFAVSLPLFTVIPLLPERLVLPWIKYQETWMDVYRKVPKLIANRSHEPVRYRDSRVMYTSSTSEEGRCSSWQRIQHRLLICYSDSGPSGLNEPKAWLGKSTGTDSDSCCAQVVAALISDVEGLVGSLTPFSSFIQNNY
ncbi:hypothetical protein DFP72DRAFT_941909 [Ephemerocybe angulata]|uniref:BTB domain-containing protein n=1 Tax=Ephemerocybe angulata TaxID=980116 RepID=A0A8H6H795_9AGAR|nr:hypothetical protein DFP72DRAFT_941909 [Tulosesus angulatus]